MVHGATPLFKEMLAGRWSPFAFLTQLVETELNPKAGDQIAIHLPGRMSQVVGRDGTVNLDFGQYLATIFALFWGCQTRNFPSFEWDNICSARNQEIYWRIALLAYDEPFKTLRGGVKMTGTQKPVRAITFAAPKRS
jgi:hypothetical protein